jgi:ubiquinone/menaquinone biosynthesis C-methylase UbiE
MSPQLRDYPRYGWQLISGFRTRKESDEAERRVRDLSPYLDLSRPLDVLDVANGRLRPQYAILRSAGHRVIGIDLINRPQSNWIDLAYRGMRCVYARKLGLSAQAMAECGLAAGDVGLMPFRSSSFDLAISSAAFEHFLDVPAVVAELHRVLRPGGMVWVSIHLFTSPTGGHNLSFTEFPLRTIPRGVEPWDHLRRRALPFTVPLNKWRKHQYLEAFARHFELLASYCARREGEQWLTPETLAALPGYTTDELTCVDFVLVARKACDDD